MPTNDSKPSKKDGFVGLVAILVVWICLVEGGKALYLHLPVGWQDYLEGEYLLIRLRLLLYWGNTVTFWEGLPAGIRLLVIISVIDNHREGKNRENR